MPKMGDVVGEGGLPDDFGKPARRGRGIGGAGKADPNCNDLAKHWRRIWRIMWPKEPVPAITVKDRAHLKFLITNYELDECIDAIRVLILSFYAFADLYRIKADRPNVQMLQGYRNDIMGHLDNGFRTPNVRDNNMNLVPQARERVKSDDPWQGIFRTTLEVDDVA